MGQFRGFDAYVEGRLDLTAPNLVQVTYEAAGNGNASLNFSCGMGGCSGTPTVSFSWSNSGAVNFIGDGVRAIAKPGIFGGVEGYLETPEFFNVHAGVEPYVKGDFWAYSGTGCSTAVASKSGPGDYAKALIADLDGGLDVLAGVDASGLVKNTPLQFAGGALENEWTIYEWQKHLDFHDFIGSTALRPIIATQAPRSGSNYLVRADMGSCYPYRTEQNNNPVSMTYRLDWGDGSPFSTPQANVGSPASATHSWSSTGTFPVKATAFYDSHGRQFPQAQVTQVSVQVQNAGTVAVIKNPTRP